MSNSVEIIKDVGIIASLLGVIGTAIKAGQWKGEHDVRINTLENVLKNTVAELSKMHDKVDGIERELLEVMTGLRKDVEYIKISVDEVKNRRRE
ncbi:MAG: hypothetical protein FWG29_01800 [Treponema sp.]|nr:hypothetical protein [Treponema sp.]